MSTMHNRDQDERADGAGEDDYSASLARRVRVLLPVLLTGVLVAFNLRAGEEASGPTPLAGLRDVESAVRARRALHAVPSLTRLNLGVKVQGGVATVWGPVPSDAVLREAIEELRRVPGICAVRNDLFVSPLAGRIEPPLFVLDRDPPVQTESLSPNSALASPGALTTRPAQEGRLKATPGSRERNSAPAGATLLPPVEASGGETSAPPSAGSGADSLAVCVERLRQSDTRFRDIQAEVSDRTVLLRGGDGERLMAFAQALTRLPGVQRVVVRPASPPIPH
jgi:osmotically-inducible protein OsmY